MFAMKEVLGGLMVTVGKPSCSWMAAGGFLFPMKEVLDGLMVTGAKPQYSWMAAGEVLVAIKSYLGCLWVRFLLESLCSWLTKVQIPSFTTSVLCVREAAHQCIVGNQNNQESVERWRLYSN